MAKAKKAAATSPEPVKAPKPVKSDAQKKWEDYLAATGIVLNPIQAVVGSELAAAIGASKEQAFWNGGSVGQTFLLAQIDKCFGGA